MRVINSCISGRLYTVFVFLPNFELLKKGTTMQCTTTATSVLLLVWISLAQALTPDGELLHRWRRNPVPPAAVPSTAAAVSPDALARFGLWSTFVRNRTLEERSTAASLPLLVEGWQVVWDHQHPRDCESANFLIGTAPASGFGANLQMEADNLALALILNRVYIQAPITPDSMEWTINTPHCQKQRKRNAECYFEQLTNCTMVRRRRVCVL